MLTLPFQIASVCLNENEADVENESYPYRGREYIVSV